MNATNRSDYFPSADEDRSNGHNGNGHPKIFSLKPATDPDTLAILDARRRVLAEKRLTRSMKALFCEVLDRALNPTMRGFLCKGVVAASDTTLARHFMVSARTVYTWKYAVADLGYFWISKKFVTNHEPITVYNITALHPPKESEMQNADGASQTGPVRYGGWVDRDGKHHLGALGARTPGQPGLPLPGSRQPPPAAESASLQGISGETGKKLRVTPEEKIGSHPKPISGLTRSQFRVRPEASFRSHPKQTAD